MVAMKSLMIALWISLFAFMSFGGFETADRNIHDLQCNTGLGDDDAGGTLNP
jgi:hypothetical protein